MQFSPRRGPRPTPILSLNEKQNLMPLPRTDSPHIYNHRVDEDEVVDIPEKPGEDRAGREGARIALGQTVSGRYLRVVPVPDPDPDSVFVIAAWELTGKPLAEYRKRRKKKGL